jgi:hypothetical protein
MWTAHRRHAPRRRPESANFADLLTFQTSFDTMVTNLMAYAASGEVNLRRACTVQIINAGVDRTFTFGAARWPVQRDQPTRSPPPLRDRQTALRSSPSPDGRARLPDQYLYRAVEPGARKCWIVAVAADRQGRWLQATWTGFSLAASQRLSLALFGIAAVVLAVALAVFSNRHCPSCACADRAR